MSESKKKSTPKKTVEKILVLLNDYRPIRQGFDAMSPEGTLSLTSGLFRILREEFKPKDCVWTDRVDGDIDASCGETLVFGVTTSEMIAHSQVYCHRCGGRIVEKDK
jgi:hypothetical protein